MTILLADPDQRIYEGWIPGVDEARLQQAVEALAPRRFDLAGDNHRSPGNGILEYANAVLRGQPASRPETVHDLRYSYPSTAEQVAHKVIPVIQAQLAEQLGRLPAIAVLAPSNALAASISEAISEDRQAPNGQVLPAIDHELVWDPGLSAAAGFVVASILEWPTLAPATTLRNIADFYRVKLAHKQTASAKSAITSIETAITRFLTGKSAVTSTAKAIISAYDGGLQLTGNPVTDWRIARARLHGSPQLEEVFSRARLLRLLRATDALAWGLNDIWDGRASYPGAADAVRRILADELIVGRPAESHPVTVMNMYKSKGKEFDAVLIVEGQHHAKLLDRDWDARRITQQRRVLRVAITRARHAVIFIRHRDAAQLTALAGRHHHRPGPCATVRNMAATKEPAPPGKGGYEIPGRGAHPAREQSVAAGKAARQLAPLASHRDFSPAASRDPIGLLLHQAESRVPELVPVRHGRMLVSPFAYYRGAALPMAADLAGMRCSGLRVQLCGDAHLLNFGAFASPERRLVFDLNDFDETLPGPFEWDVKRLVASMAVAGRDNGLTAKKRHRVALAAAAAYRTAMREFAAMSILDVWYARFDVEDALAQLKSDMPKKTVRQTKAQMAKARTRDSTQALAKLATVEDGQRRIISDPPLIVPLEELAGHLDVDVVYWFLRHLFTGYTRTLPAYRRRPAERFTLTRVARKVVGVGSVGTETWILLMEPDDGFEPLLLQAKQAQRSVLADYAGQSEYRNQGERVVAGQHLMQAVSDIFLGWQSATPPGRRSADYYFRQLRDWKYSAPIEDMNAAALIGYGRMCGWTLARAHARTGDRIAIAAYLGGSDTFDQAMAEFGETYADQTERDHAALAAAVASGSVQAQMGI